MLDLWLRILDIMDRLMNSGQGDNLVGLCAHPLHSPAPSLFLSSSSRSTHVFNPRQEEAVPESLKNILLVMTSGGYLVPPQQDPRHEKLWFETWTRLDRFLPRLYSEIYPDAPQAPSQLNPQGVEGPQPPAQLAAEST